MLTSSAALAACADTGSVSGDDMRDTGSVRDDDMRDTASVCADGKR
ncbi:hypothetical protein [Kribbella italica]|uniref:Uncharacterized protein n=1 Tax=Kribbella italica TaxID=1540520 RepID=A0A7W9MRI7_9ACTN|nr:hypothetical protein [Kribbella italica]MBB5833671.1 hypothetical protein [Kribbella italica]